MCLPSRAGFYARFIRNCGRGDGLMITTYLGTVARCKQLHAPCKILLLQQSVFFVSVGLHRDHKTVPKMG